MMKIIEGESSMQDEQIPIPTGTEHSQAITTLEQIRATVLAVAQWAEQQMQREGINIQCRGTIGMGLSAKLTVDQWQPTEGPLPF
jgi:hypothetical protein